jgi:predicted nucleic acid-binding protein
VNPVVYDTGALVAADRDDRAFWLRHRARLDAGLVPVVPAPVVAQASRSHRQVQLRRLLKGCDVKPFREPEAHAAGRLLRQSKTTDVVDAAVVALAVEQRAEIVTADRRDIEQLLIAARSRLPVVDV